MAALAPFAHPLYLFAKPVGSLCNLQCDYCYYLGKRHLYPSQHVMDESTLEMFVTQYLEAQTQRDVLFTWHGGEPLLLPLSFYKRAMELQQKHARGHHIDNCLQTNGTLLTDEWCAFFRENNWLIGISIDGPQELHDRYRCAQGSQPSFHKVMRGIRLLQKHGVEWNAMGVVNDCNADHPLDVYHFYKDTGCHFIQFTPIVGWKGAVRHGQYARFCCDIFDEWVRQDVGQVFVQLFDSTLARWMGVEAAMCSMGETCGHAGVIEHNGDVYSCDHFVFPEHLLGNIHHDTVTAMMYSQRQLFFGRQKRDSLPQQCKECQWLFACNGGCPKDRSAEGLNHLCQDYRQFFSHVAPYMDFMKNELLHQRPPANIMIHLGQQRFCQ